MSGGYSGLFKGTAGDRAHVNQQYQNAVNNAQGQAFEKLYSQAQQPSLRFFFRGSTSKSLALRQQSCDFFP